MITIRNLEKRYDERAVVEAVQDVVGAAGDERGAAEEEDEGREEAAQGGARREVAAEGDVRGGEDAGTGGEGGREERGEAGHEDVHGTSLLEEGGDGVLDAQNLRRVDVDAG